LAQGSPGRPRCALGPVTARRACGAMPAAGRRSGGRAGHISGSLAFCIIGTRFAPGATSEELVWERNGCDPRLLCECKLNGVVASIKGTDIAEECQDNGLAVPKTDQYYRVKEALSTRPFQYQCDSLKLNAYCFNALGCMTDTNKAYCSQQKGGTCDVDCNAAPRLHSGGSMLALLVGAYVMVSRLVAPGLVA